MKRSISLFLAILMVLSTLTVMSVSVSAETVSGEGWELTDGVFTLTGKFELKGLGSQPTDYEWYDYRDSITKVIVKGSAEQIPGRAFSQCGNLSEVVIEEGVAVIDSDAFANRKLSSITFPASLTTINQGAFISCSIEHMYAPYMTYTNFLSSITVYDYNDGWGLQPAGFTCTTDAQPYTLEDGVLTILFDVDYTAADAYPWIKYADQITKVVTTSDVKVIGARAFSWSDSQGKNPYVNLTEVVLSDSVTTIKGDAFSHLPNLTTITIDNSVTEIYGGAFFGFNKLSTVKGGFAKGASLAAVTSDVYNGPLFNAIESGYEFLYEGIYTLENGVLTVLVDINYNAAADYPWYGERASVTTAVFAKGLTYIGVRAVEKFPNMKTVIVCDGIQEIKGDAFAWNPQLENIMIPNTVTKMAGGIMYGSDGNIKNVYSNFENSVEFAKVWTQGGYNGAFGTEEDAKAVKDGYVTFWYSKDAKFIKVDEVSLVTGTTADIVYAGTQDSKTDNAVRFVGATTSLDYAMVGMIIATKDAEGNVKSYNVSSTTVFDELKSADGTYEAPEGQYLFGVELYDITEGTYTFSVQTYAVTTTGTVLIGSLATLQAQVTANGSVVSQA